MYNVPKRNGSWKKSYVNDGIIIIIFYYHLKPPLENKLQGDNSFVIVGTTVFVTPKAIPAPGTQHCGLLTSHSMNRWITCSLLDLPVSILSRYICVA